MISIHEIEGEMPGEAKLVQFVAFEDDGSTARNDRFIASATLAHPDRVIPEIQRLFVVENRRRQGVARRLLDRCEDHCRLLGKKAIALYVGKSNGDAIGFYIACGYVMAFQFPDGDIVLSKQIS